MTINPQLPGTEPNTFVDRFCLNQSWILWVLMLIVGGVFLWVQSIPLPSFRGPHGYVLVDPDSYMHWHLMRRALAGEGVRIRWMNEDNAPYGRLNEWTSPTTIFGVTLTRMFEIFGGEPREQALRAASHWMGPVIGLLNILALGLFGRRAGGVALAACWLLAWPGLNWALYKTEFGVVGHRGLHQLLFICLVGGCLAWRRQPRVAGGVCLGLIGALGLWSGASELLPACLLVAGLAVYDNVFATSVDEAVFSFWRAWWICGCLGTCVAWLFEFWPHPFHGHLEFISVWHVALWVIVGGLMEASRGFPWVRSHRLLAISIAVLLALLAAGAMRGFAWGKLHVMQDPRFGLQALMTVEFASVFEAGWRHALEDAWWGYGLLPLLFVYLKGRWSNLERTGRWLLLVAGMMLLVSLYQERWQALFVIALVMSSGVIIRLRWPQRPQLCVLAMVVATLPAWHNVLRQEQGIKAMGGNPMRGLNRTTIGLEVVSDCFGRMAPGSVVLAPWDQSGVLAGLGNVRVIGSGYWSNLDGLFADYELFTTTSTERFRALVGERQIQFLLVRRPNELYGDIVVSFVTLLGRIPTETEVGQTVLWKTANDPHARVVTCPELGSGWKIIQLP
ncbi:MAG TPA: hypothetical protein VNL17_07570 [Verrucomicrobiae bacterium]|nr:hypothetical protein [Verrucomicrobiae bacterium]